MNEFIKLVLVDTLNFCIGLGCFITIWAVCDSAFGLIDKLINNAIKKINTYKKSKETSENTQSVD